MLHRSKGVRFRELRILSCHMTFYYLLIRLVASCKRLGKVFPVFIKANAKQTGLPWKVILCEQKNIEEVFNCRTGRLVVFK